VRRRALVAAWLLAAGVAIVIGGCSTPILYTPATAGVVERNEPLPDGTSRLTLADGREITVDVQRQAIVYGSALPTAGELLLGGDDPRPWVARLPGPEPCFWIGGRGTEDGGFIKTAVGLRLPKAVDFDRAHYHESEHEFNGGGFCVSAAGEVTAVR
jgi:hypothetical protein